MMSESDIGARHMADDPITRHFFNGFIRESFRTIKDKKRRR